MLQRGLKFLKVLWIKPCAVPVTSNLAVSFGGQLNNYTIILHCMRAFFCIYKKTCGV